MSNQMNIVAVDARRTISELDALLRDTLFGLQKTKTPFWLLISGYDDDTRELWEIPEAQEDASRLVELGFMTPLHLVPNWQSQGGPGSYGLSAWALWLLSKGEMKQTMYLAEFVEREQEFMADICRSNARCDRLLGA